MAASSLEASAAAAAPSAASHIVLETSSPEERLTRRPETVVEQFELKNLFRARRTRLTLYKEGFLVVQTEFGGARRKERTLDLRFLDSRPRVSRVDVGRLLYAAGGAAAGAILLFAFAGLGLVAPVVCSISAVVLALAAGILGWRFLGANGELAVFRTARGHGEVLELFGAIGDVATLRRIVPAIVAGIRAAAEPGVDPQIYLREEMREHYRLAQTGVISEDECSTCTQRILHHFHVEPRHQA